MTDQNPVNLKIKQEQKLAWDDSAEAWKNWWPTFERDAMVNSARAFAGADNVVRLNNETILFSARASR